MAETGATVVAADVAAGPCRPRAAPTPSASGSPTVVLAVVADGDRPPLPPASFDRVLVDAPCSGLGALRRRPDARWRIEEARSTAWRRSSADLLAAAADLVRPGGVLVYSVCTLTVAEGPEVAARLDWPAEPPPAEPWRPWGTRRDSCPQSAGTDGMFLARWPARPESARAAPEFGDRSAPAPDCWLRSAACRWRKVLTVSDGVMAGTREDRSGDVAVEVLDRAPASRSSTGASSPTASTPSPPRSATSPPGSPASS